jgi:hypothetical protein
MKLTDANTSPTMTPYCSGFPVNMIPPVDMDEMKWDKLRSTYQSHLGMINWLSISTRPDVTTIQSLLAQYTTTPTSQHLDATRYVGRYLKSTADLGISFSSRSNPTLDGSVHFPVDPQNPTGFANAGWGPQDASNPSSKSAPHQVAINETKSICSHFIFMCGGPVLWKSHKERCNSRSSAEAEVKSTDECTKSCQWLHHVLDDMGLLPTGPTKIYNDNKAAVDWSNMTSHKGMHHMNICESAVHKAIHVYNKIKVEHIGGKTNVSDLLTKEHKSDIIYLDIRDSFMSHHLHGGR